MKNETRMRLSLIFDGEDHRLGQIVNFTIMFLIAVSVITVTVASLPDLPGWLYTSFRWVELFMIVFFTVEYFLRIWSAQNPIKYIFSFWGIIDICAILPMLLFVHSDTLMIRIIRLLRIFRILKLGRYTRAAERLQFAFNSVRDELMLFAGITVTVLFVCAAGIHFFEHRAQPEAFNSIPQSLWWAIVTLTTVGYGDTYPITVGGRIFTAAVLIVGLGIVAVPTGLIAAALSQPEDDN